MTPRSRRTADRRPDTDASQATQSRDGASDLISLNPFYRRRRSWPRHWNSDPESEPFAFRPTGDDHERKLAKTSDGFRRAAEELRMRGDSERHVAR